MNNIQRIKNAYAAAIELAEKSNSSDRKELSNIYHLLKFVRSAAKEYKLEEMVAEFDIHTAKIRRAVGKKLARYAMMSTDTDGENKRIRLNSPFTNVHCALTYFIRQSLRTCPHRLKSAKKSMQIRN
ncbi:MAG: hypothetical protein NC253_16130, partial [Ruminococcus sp.]|nr:hypothetical protein [Ruminococcus sp.]MCM1381050.1 hypothetical protein [Muribaculaceae bacterium]